jgi:Fe2+ transport system protein B
MDSILGYLPFIQYIIGVLYGLFGYWLAHWEGEGFEPKKFLKTVILGIIITFLVQVLHIPLSQLEATGLMALITILVDKVINTLLGIREANLAASAKVKPK